MIVYAQAFENLAKIRLVLFSATVPYSYALILETSRKHALSDLRAEALEYEISYIHILRTHEIFMMPF